MKRFCKTGPLIFIAVITVIIGDYTHCEEGQIDSQINSFEGRVSYLDWVTSKMVVNGAGVMEFHVPDRVSIRKLGSHIMLMDINILDDVVVEYYSDESGRNVAISITVKVV